MIKHLLSVAIVSLAYLAGAQNVEFKAANFKDDKEGLKKATEAIKKGDEYFEIANAAIFEVKAPGLNYELALQQYEKAQQFNPNQWAPQL